MPRSIFTRFAFALWGCLLLTSASARAATAVADSNVVLLGWQLVPAQPHAGDAVSLRVWGRTGFVSPEVVLPIFDPQPEPDFLHVTLSPSGASDTTHAWSYEMPMGTPAAGGHDVAVWMLVSGESHVMRLVHYDVLATAAVPGSQAGEAPDVVLARPVPSPTRDGTRFEVSLGQPGWAELILFDAAGRRVRGLHAGFLPRGTSRLEWDGRDSRGRHVRAGVYVARLAAAGRVVDRRVVVVGR